MRVFINFFVFGIIATVPAWASVRDQIEQVFATYEVAWEDNGRIVIDRMTALGETIQPFDARTNPFSCVVSEGRLHCQVGGSFQGRYAKYYVTGVECPYVDCKTVFSGSFRGFALTPKVFRIYDRFGNRTNDCEVIFDLPAEGIQQQRYYGFWIQNYKTDRSVFPYPIPIRLPAKPHTFVYKDCYAH